MERTSYRKAWFVRCATWSCVCLLLVVVMHISGCPAPAPTPMPTPAPIHTPTPTPTPLPATDVILRLHGSNTLAAQLIPDIAEAFLRTKGSENIGRQADAESDTLTIQGAVADAASPQVIEILSGGAGTAFASLAAGSCDIALSVRGIEESDVGSVSIFGDVTTPENERVLGLDGIAILVNQENPVDTLSREQIVRIFSGDIQNWAQVGGNTGKIRVYAPDDTSGTSEAFKQRALVNTALTANAVLTEEPALSEKVSEDTEGIGFVRLAYSGASKVIAVTDGEFWPMRPDMKNVTTETYPFSYRLYLYLSPNSNNQVAREFVDFALSETGQQIVARHKFVDVHMTLGQQTDDGANDQTYRKITQGAEQFLGNIRIKEEGTTLDNKSLHDIDRIAEYLRSHEHDAERGIALLEFWDAPHKNQRYNQELSLQLARAVEHEFHVRDIIPSVIAGFGKTSFGTADNTAQKRVVEVWLIDPDRNSGLNRQPSGAQVLPVNGSDPGGAADYDKGDRTDWYRVVIRGKGGTFTYRVQQYQEHDSTLSVAFYYAPKTYRTLDEGNPMGTFVLRGKDENSYTVEDAQPGVYYAKILAKNAGDESAYKISNSFVPVDGGSASPTPVPEEPVESVTPIPTPVAEPDIQKPVITILTPAPNSTITEDAVRITGTVISDRAILQLMINGQPISLTDAKRVRDGNRHVLEFSHHVASLKTGENVLVLAAWDELGNIGAANIRIVRQ